MEGRRRKPFERSSHWVFTINNYTGGDSENIQNLIEKSPGVICGIAEMEHTDGNGTPHIQGFISFGKRLYRSSVERFLGQRAYVEKAKGSWQQNFKYCSKEGKVFAIRGHTLEELKEKENKKKITIEEMINDMKKLTYKEAIEKYPEEWYRNRERMSRLLMEEQMKQIIPWTGNLQLKNVWLWGEPGVGKSRWANCLIGPEHIFKKNVNKWWDGYNLFETRLVIIEDWPSKAERKDVLSQHVKVWGDRYPFIGECKGSHLQVDPGRFSLIITSNYSIDDCFECPEDIKAIKRRFQEIQMTKENKTMINAMELPLSILNDYSFEDKLVLEEETSNED